MWGSQSKKIIDLAEDLDLDLFWSYANGHSLPQMARKKINAINSGLPLERSKHI